MKDLPVDTAYIIGGGPSLVGQDLCLAGGLKYYLRDKFCIACNDSIYIGPEWIDILWFCDYEWWEKRLCAPGLFQGLIAHCSTRDYVGCFRMRRGKEYGIDTRPNTVAWNNSAGNAAINLAWHWGAKTVVLLGFDAGETIVRGNRETNWYPRKGKQHKSTWDRFLKAYPYIKQDADKLGLEILNATPNSRIKEFPFVRLEEIK